jgi:hypothetical protein
MMRTVFLAAAILILSGCGSNDSSEIASGTVTDSDGKAVDYRVTQSEDGDAANITIKTDEGQMQFGSGAGNAKLPAGFTLYPGAKLTGGFDSSANGKSATMANFEVSGKGADVIAHYRKQAEAQGMTIKGEMSSPGNIILTAKQDQPTKRSVQVTAAEADGKVTGTIMAQTGD